jgi:hypothetical protein
MLVRRLHIAIVTFTSYTASVWRFALATIVAR